MDLRIRLLNSNSREKTMKVIFLQIDLKFIFTGSQTIGLMNSLLISLLKLQLN